MAHGSKRPAWLVAGILFICSVSVSLAGTTGKIAGKVSDVDGAPLPGVAVMVESTRLGATTDTEGRFVVLQVPAGVRTVTARLIGYRSTSVTNTTVSADLTTQLNFTLDVQAVETEAVVVQATRPPIEKDVTSSQIIIGAEQVANAPVSEVLDYLAYEPGVGIQKENELTIRSGGPEEIRFQVDGMDRTDALTNKGLTHLNQTLVSEVTVLTGGFNAEYGNMRSGVVNAIYKDGTERSWGLPWVAAVVSGAPAQKKHFGPRAYSPDQYDFQIMADPANTGAMMPKREDLNDDGVQDADEPIVYKADGTPELVPLDNVNTIFWSDLYEVTRNDTAIQSMRENNFSLYKQLFQLNTFPGWKKRKGAFGRGVYNFRGWEPEELREVWEWTSNMNEVAWTYGGSPDYNIDFSVGQALPNRWGGIVFGYSYAKVMTALPAVRNFYSDKTIDVKLTLTPTDNLKLMANYLIGEGLSSGAAAHGATRGAELELGGSVAGNDPISIRTPGALSGQVNHHSEDRENNKSNLSLNAELNGEYRQVGGSLTYTLSPTTIFEFGFSRLETEWNQPRVAPRADVTDFRGGYKHQKSYAWGGKGGLLDYLSGNHIYTWVKLPKFEQQDDGSFVDRAGFGELPHPPRSREEFQYYSQQPLGVA
ncbi:MAG: carboxypeptidase regulatory-like domain-containing protein [Candidatus Latescibacteria bacterium]|nr:carboxypeptidase regulatory-like domain-containing protein [Candidatus Latescibacterota bacterium]